jgi:trigger factor
VTATVSDAGPFEKLVGFAVTEAEIEAAKGRAARKLARDIKIRGFRPGKAPRPVVEATVGSERLRAEAIDEALPDLLEKVLAEFEMDPATPPVLESMLDGADGVDVQVKVTLWPRLDTIPEHEGRSIDVGSPEVTDEELSRQIDRIRDQFADLTEADGPVREGDYATIDISATSDGDDIPEAGAEQLLYEVGSGRFIEGIDEHLVGVEPGSAVTFDGRLPAGFGELAGNPATFTVAVGSVRRKVLPALTDEWVAEVTEFGSVAELEVNLETRMHEAKRRQLAARFRELALEELVNQVDVVIPDALVRAEMDELLHRFAHRLEEQGLSLEDYFRATNFRQEDLVDDIRRQADRSLRTRLLLEAVAERSGLEVDDAEVAAVIESVAVSSDRPEEIRRVLREGPGEKSLVGDILRNRALDVIVAGATPVDEDGNPVDLEADEVAVATGRPVGEMPVGTPLSGAEVGGEVEAEIVDTGAAGFGEEE